MMINSCNLCHEINKVCNNSLPNEYNALVSSGKNLVFESKNFILIPSIGPLNASHLMLVPKTHINNFAQLSNRQLEESSLILKSLSKYYFDKFSKHLVYFESGAGEKTSHSGGCIIHAHIHCLEFTEGFEKKLFEETNLEVIPSVQDSKVDKKYGYIWYKNTNNIQYLCNKPYLPSQFLRFLYAESSRNNTPWNWRKNPNLNKVYQVLQSYSEFRLLN